MPGMDGLELLGEIKQHCPDLPVMMVTAYGDDERRRRARELGAFEFITKPVDFDQLKEQLRQLPTAMDCGGTISSGVTMGVRDRDCCAEFCSLRWGRVPRSPHCAEAATIDHAVSPEANRRPDRKSSQCSGFRYGRRLGIMTGVIARNRRTISRASSSLPICA
jgi:hypothetical protein